MVDRDEKSQNKLHCYFPAPVKFIKVGFAAAAPPHDAAASRKAPTMLTYPFRDQLVPKAAD